MYFTNPRTTRLLLTGAAINGITGLSLYLLPPDSRGWPYLSAGMVAGAVALLMLSRYSVRPAVQRAVLFLAALPLLVLGYMLGQAGLRVAPFFCVPLGVGLLLSPWSQRIPGDRDLFELVFGVAHAAAGLFMLLMPGAFQPEMYAAIRPVLPLVGMTGLLGAAALLTGPGAPCAKRWRWGRRIAGALFPLWVVYNSAQAGSTVGVMTYGLLAAAALLGSPHAGRLMDLEKDTLPHLDRSLELWSWLLTLAVLFTTVADPHSGGSPGAVLLSLFIVVMTAYTALAHWVFPALGTPEQRIACHLTFLTLMIGLLTSNGAPGRHSYLVLLILPTLVGARALGPRAGRRLLAVAVLAALLGDFHSPAFTLQGALSQEFWGHVVGQTLLLMAAGWLGLQYAREQWHSLQNLRVREQMFRSAFGEAPIGMALADASGRWVQVNRSLAAMLGYTEPELLALTAARLTHPDDLGLTIQSAREVGAGHRQTSQMEKRYLHRDGHPVWALVSGSSIPHNAGEQAYTILHIQDITARKETESQLVRLANFDPLTGLCNRRRFQEELEEQLTEALRTGGCGALLFLDIDQFKYVNDTLGHQAGDDLLKSVAGMLQHTLRSGDTVARLGGDEFAVLLPQADAAQAGMAADDLLEALRRHMIVVDGQPITVSASIGMALFPEHGDTGREILARADLAMYRVKEQGRNHWALFHPDQVEQARMESKLTWEQRIREALEHDQFVPYFQPILDLRTDQVVQYEMLLRLLDRQGQVVPPGAFLNVAERFGLIHALDRWVVKRAIQFIAAREAGGSPICLEVNLSGKAFADPQLLPLIRREIEATGINPALLILEITETAAIADTSLARTFVEDLAGLGCRFAIDDFGAGFSSFSYLKHLPVDYLKIDGSFIRHLPQSPIDQHLVRTFVDLARGLGKRTIAEFVGDAETVALLKEYGVDYAQGYYIGMPAPLDASVPADGRPRPAKGGHG